MVRKVVALGAFVVVLVSFLQHESAAQRSLIIRRQRIREQQERDKKKSQSEGPFAPNEDAKSQQSPYSSSEEQASSEDPFSEATEDLDSFLERIKRHIEQNAKEVQLPFVFRHRVFEGYFLTGPGKTA